MSVTAALHTRVEAKVAQVIQSLELHYNRKFATPAVDYKLRGVVAGRALCGKNIVRFQPALLAANESEYMKETIAHEVCHLIDYELNPNNFVRRYGRKRSLHGPTWQRLMRVTGHTPETTHDMDVEAVRVRQVVRHEWVCTCGATMKLGPKQHPQQLNNHDTYRPRGKGCRRKSPAHVYTYTGVVGATPAPPAPKKPKTTKAPASSNRPGSKKARAEAIYRNSMQDRSALIASFMKELDMTQAGAATYYANCKKKFG